MGAVICNSEAGVAALSTWVVAIVCVASYSIA